MTNMLQNYKNANQHIVDRSFLTNELLDIFDPKYSQHKSRINGMLENYPTQHVDNMLLNLFSANKDNFTRIVFELMLHEQLLRLGFVVVVDPELQDQQSPDFLVTSPDGNSFYLEVATVENRSGNHILDLCKKKIAEKRKHYKEILNKPLVIALNVIEGGLSQTQERDLFFGGESDNSEDGVFTKGGHSGVRDDLAGVWYFDRLDIWHLPHGRYCYIPNQYIKPQLLPSEFTSHNLLWMTEKGIEYFSGKPFLQISDDVSKGAPLTMRTSSVLEEMAVCIAVLTGFFVMLAYYLF